MKKMTFYDLFLAVTVLIAVVSNWNVYSCILLICASVLELVDVIPKIVRRLKRERD